MSMSLYCIAGEWYYVCAVRYLKQQSTPLLSCHLMLMTRSLSPSVFGHGFQLFRCQYVVEGSSQEICIFLGMNTTILGYQNILNIWVSQGGLERLKLVSWILTSGISDLILHKIRNANPGVCSKLFNNLKSLPWAFHARNQESWIPTTLSVLKFVSLNRLHLGIPGAFPEILDSCRFTGFYH